jgi:hypothetical protein
MTERINASQRSANGEIEEDQMANFGARLAYPTPDWVAYKRPSADVFAPPAPIAPTTPQRRETVYRPSNRARVRGFLASLRRFAYAWARSQAYNSFV